MPLYEYYCDKCQHAFDDVLPVSKRNEPTKQPCPECGAEEVCKGVSVTTMGADMNATPDKKTGGDWTRLMDKMKSYTPERHHESLDKPKSNSMGHLGPK